MSKKSNKTSHVLNLLTNRTGIPTAELENSISLELEENVNTQAEQAVENNVSSQIEQILENNVSNGEQAVNKQVEQVVNERVEFEIEKAISEKIADTVAEQIRINLEKEVAAAEAKAWKAAVAKVEAKAWETAAIEAKAGEEETMEAKTIASEEHPRSADPSAHDFILVNILEEVMRLTAPSVMEELGMCCCERCVNDVMAIALNAMSPKYVVTQRGALFSKVASYGNQYKTDMLSAITKACIQVKTEPSHS